MNKEMEAPPKASVLQVAKAILWAFAGIRKKSDYEVDIATLKPAQVIIGGLVGGALFIASILLLVRLVLS